MPDNEKQETQPNVLTVEEAALLVKANEQPAPDSPEEERRFSDLLDRLADWVQAEEAAQSKSTPSESKSGNSGNLAEELREEAERLTISPTAAARAKIHMLRTLADRLDNALPPDVWELLIELRDELGEGVYAEALNHLFARLNPPIQPEASQ